MAATAAASPWVKIRICPEPGRHYLVYACYGGIEAYDVAFYNGKRPDGSHHWTLANVEIDVKAITAYAEIQPCES